MKNFKLLLATTAILSTGLAMNVMAEGDISFSDSSIKTLIHAKAKLITNLSIREDAVLDFGSILAPRNNQTIEITAEGVRNSNANFVDDEYSAGAIAVSGDYYSDEHVVKNVDHTDEYYSFTFPDTMTLKAGNTVCGVVSDFTQSSEFNHGVDIGKEIVINYGGTLTLDKNIETSLALNQTVECEGEATVTLVYNYSSMGTGGSVEP